ncbi:hypothetical protein AB0D49_39435 [Streptomyces sp. NPDC048290]|uniref:hypothetical protein n=1 Tax=Streptomyces sp. NPDC048290 TaxID=3155811 RepID=UPI00342A0135
MADSNTFRKDEGLTSRFSRFQELEDVLGHLEWAVDWIGKENGPSAGSDAVGTNYKNKVTKPTANLKTLLEGTRAIVGGTATKGVSTSKQIDDTEEENTSAANASFK